MGTATGECAAADDSESADLRGSVADDEAVFFEAETGLDSPGGAEDGDEDMSRGDFDGPQRGRDGAEVVDEVDQGAGGIDGTCDDLTVPYEPADEDDDDDFSLSNVDSGFVESGWGGECLQYTEDIDFEFVYALHTFVATVEGQANATKGDTMVLLDDSNSYWWLVRVVKDSSIGKTGSPLEAIQVTFSS